MKKNIFCIMLFVVFSAHDVYASWSFWSSDNIEASVQHAIAEGSHSSEIKIDSVKPDSKALRLWSWRAGEAAFVFTIGALVYAVAYAISPAVKNKTDKTWAKLIYVVRKHMSSKKQMEKECSSEVKL